MRIVPGCGRADRTSRSKVDQFRLLGGPGREPCVSFGFAAEFNVARNTVRETLRLLTREGLATHQVHRGVTVREFAVQEVRDIYGARKLIQAEAGKRAGTLTPDEISALAAEVEKGRGSSRQPPALI